MKRISTLLLLLIAAAFVLAPAAFAKGNYKSELSEILLEICGSSECKGDIVNGKLILIGKDGKKHAAPDGEYTDDADSSIRVINGKVLKKAEQPMRRGR